MDFIQANTATIAQGATDIVSTMSAIDGLRDDLERTVINPLKELWTGDAATAYAEIQAEWIQASLAINDLLKQIGAHTGTSAAEFVNAEDTNIRTWT